MVSVVESAMEEISLQEEESSTEYRVLMAYAQRTLPASKYAQLAKPVTPQAGNNGKESQAASNGELPHKERKRKKSRRLPKMLVPKCLRPPDQEKAHRCDQDGRSSEERRARSIARSVQRIIRRIREREQDGDFRNLRRVYSVEVDGDGTGVASPAEIPCNKNSGAALPPADVSSDRKPHVLWLPGEKRRPGAGADEDELIASLVQILRLAGDELNDQITQDQPLQERVQSLWSYRFFTKVADLFLSDRDAGLESEEERQTNRIALCVHATTTLTALDNQAMNRVLGFGARYLRENYGAWVQSRGGLETVMAAREDEDEVD